MKFFSICWLLLTFILGCSDGHSQSFDYLPTTTAKQVIEHDYFTISYSETHEQAEWVAYRLTEERVKGDYERTNNYRADRNVDSRSATLTDYKGSGYDRGHLAPAKAMAFSATAMSESFYLSNISPQDASFNRGIWRQLESQVRQWANTNDELYVVTGPVLNHCQERIGPNNVCVPEQYYKVILDYRKPEVKAIGFLLPNQKGDKELSDYAVPIDRVEAKTDIDFFHNLPNQVEQRLEQSSQVSQWDFDTNHIPSSGSDKPSSAKRCKGETQDGDRCQRKTASANQYCWQHNDQANNSSIENDHGHDSKSNSSGKVRCKAQTNDGDRCKRMTSNDSGYCWQHE